LSILLACVGDRRVLRARAAADPIQYARRQVGRRVYGGQTAHLPLKVNMASMIPPIFASSS
jgi:preprotein translocase subunit SecY